MSIRGRRSTRIDIPQVVTLDLAVRLWVVVVRGGNDVRDSKERAHGLEEFCGELISVNEYPRLRRTVRKDPRFD